MESTSSEPTQHLNDGLFLEEGMFENPNELDIDWACCSFLILSFYRNNANMLIIEYVALSCRGREF